MFISEQNYEAAWEEKMTAKESWEMLNILLAFQWFKYLLDFGPEHVF